MGCQLTLQKNSDDLVLSHPAGADNAGSITMAGRVIIEDISLYVPHYNPNKSNQKLMSGHILSKTPTELFYIKRSSHMKDVSTEYIPTFEHGVGYCVDLPIRVKVGLMRRDQFNQQHQKKIHFIDQV